MRYPNIYGVRLSSELSAQVAAHADDLGVGQSTAIRLIVREFFKTPRQPRRAVRRERLRAPERAVQVSGE